MKLLRILQLQYQILNSDMYRNLFIARRFLLLSDTGDSTQLQRIIETQIKLSRHVFFSLIETYIHCYHLFRSWVLICPGNSSGPNVFYSINFSLNCCPSRHLAIDCHIAVATPGTCMDYRNTCHSSAKINIP